jgi:mono/diheme cytochrome c family protein
VADTPEERPDDEPTIERPHEGASHGAVEKTTGGAGAPAPRPAAAPPAVPAAPTEPPYVTAHKTRRKMPLWAVPVLVALPIWAIIYVNAVTKPPVHDPLTVGGQIYADQCASCHGADGQGVSGPALAGGDVLKTWPDYKDHITWVEEGSDGWKASHPGATTYGAQNHPLQSGMPSFKDTLSSADIAMVVRYEREVLSQADPTSEAEKTLVACTEAALTDSTVDCTKFTG